MININKISEGGVMSDVIKTNLKEQNDRVQQQNKASLVLIDGGVGQGKTTFAVHCADYINELNGLPKINLDEKSCVQYAYGGAEFIEKLRLCYEQKIPVLIYDEGGDLNKRKSLSKFNEQLNRVFETYRAFKILVIMCLPYFGVIDNDLFDKQIPRVLFHCHSRNENRTVIDVFGLYRMAFLRFYVSKIINKPYAYKRTVSNARGFCLNLDEERQEKLVKISTKKKLETLFQTQIRLEGLLTYEDITRLTHVPHAKIADVFKKLKIKPARKYRLKLYFHEEVINLFDKPEI